MTQEEWDEKWWELYYDLVKLSHSPSKAFEEAHRRMRRTFGQRPKSREEIAGLPFLVRLLFPLLGEKAEMITKVWEWFSGKKTLIGAVITFLSLLVGAVPPLLAAFGIDAVQIATVVGVLTTIVGLLHKLYKFFYKEEHP